MCPMSWVLQAAVFELQIASSEKFTLIAMANFASDDGSNCYPSVATLCRKTSQSRRTVQRNLRTLEESGLVKRTGKSGGSRKNTSRYRLLIPSKPEPAANPAKPAPPKPLSEKEIPTLALPEKQKAVREVWDYYLEKFNRLPAKNTFSPKFERWGLRCFDHIYTKIENPTSDRVVSIMQGCVGKLAADDFSNGRSRGSKGTYTEWKHLFDTTERLEKWLNKY
jgi:hypothetical protein